MPLSLTRRLLLCVIAIGTGSLFGPLKSLGQDKKKLPPCEAKRSFGDWEAKVWDTAGGLHGVVSHDGSQVQSVPPDRCGFIEGYPGLYVTTDPKGKAIYSIGFGCPNSLLSQNFDVTVKTADGKELSGRIDAFMQPIEKTSASGVWLNATSLFSGQGSDLITRGGRLSLKIKSDANAALELNLDASRFPDAWQFMVTQFAKLNGQRGKQCGCFITTACCQYFDLDDNCFELRTLRAFRDGPMMRMPGGQADISRYYDTAPFILRAMHAAGELRLLTGIYFSYILPSAVAAHLGLYALTRWLYTRMMRDLETRYSALIASIRCSRRVFTDNDLFSVLTLRSN